MSTKFEKFTIFGTEFKFRLIDFNLSTLKNISINNENFRFFTKFLIRFEEKFNEIQQNSALTKNVFSINFGGFLADGESFDINENLTIKRITNNSFVLFFNDFKDLSQSILQFQDGSIDSGSLIKLDFNYKISKSIDGGKYDRLFLEYDSSNVEVVNLIII